MDNNHQDGNRPAYHCATCMTSAFIYSSRPRQLNRHYDLMHRGWIGAKPDLVLCVPPPNCFFCRNYAGLGKSSRPLSNLFPLSGLRSSAIRLECGFCDTLFLARSFFVHI
jgi:hypothetical protein